MKKPFLFLSLITLSTIIVWGCSRNNLIEITIASYGERYEKRGSFFVKLGNRFADNNGNVYELAGAEISIHYPNELPEYLDKIKKELIGKTVKIKIIEKAKDYYPKFPLVLIYFNENDKMSFNERWLREGNAFFDHGYYKGKEVFQGAEKYARDNKLGVWKEIDKLKVLYIGHKDWSFFYKPEDPKVKEIPEKDRVYYYVAPPVIAGYKAYMPIGREKKNW